MVVEARVCVKHCGHDTVYMVGGSCIAKMPLDNRPGYEDCGHVCTFAPAQPAVHEFVPSSDYDFCGSTANEYFCGQPADAPVHRTPPAAFDPDADCPCGDLRPSDCAIHQPAAKRYTVDEVEAMLAGITPEPWKINNYRPYGIIARDPNESTYKIGDDKFERFINFSGDNQPDNARFVAAAPAIIWQLLDENKRWKSRANQVALEGQSLRTALAAAEAEAKEFCAERDALLERNAELQRLSGRW